MANKKISQLTPKGSALAGTDLLEVSVFNGVTYDTKSLTGANVVSGLQPTLFSGTNIKTINSTSLLGSGDIVISTGLTVGTTPITSGTVGRVLFQGTGNVVQQDSTFLFDSTAKTLTNYGKGGFNSNTSFGVTAGQSNISGIQNSFFGFETLTNNQTGSFNTAMGYTALRNTTGIGYNTAIGWGAGIGISSGHTNTLLGYGAGSGITTGNSNTIIGVNIATLAAGTLNNVILADGGGNIAIRKDANHFVGVGYSATATLGAKLDIKAQGALSTDIALRVRNSADSSNLQQFTGDGGWIHRNNAGSFYEYYDGLNTIEYRYPGVFNISTNNDVTSFRFSCNAGDVLLRGGSNILNIVNANNYHFEESTGTLPTSGAGAIVMKNRTAPSTNVQDRFYLYSADIVAGNAAPHFRTENGSVVKLYQQTTAVASATVVSGSGGNVKHDDTFDGYTVEQVVRALRNTGLLA